MQLLSHLCFIFVFIFWGGVVLCGWRWLRNLMRSTHTEKLLVTSERIEHTSVQKKDSKKNADRTGYYLWSWQGEATCSAINRTKVQFDCAEEKKKSPRGAVSQNGLQRALLALLTLPTALCVSLMGRGQQKVPLSYSDYRSCGQMCVWPNAHIQDVSPLQWQNRARSWPISCLLLSVSKNMFVVLEGLLIDSPNSSFKAHQ